MFTNSIPTVICSVCVPPAALSCTVRSTSSSSEAMKRTREESSPSGTSKVDITAPVQTGDGNDQAGGSTVIGKTRCAGYGFPNSPSNRFASRVSEAGRAGTTWKKGHIDRRRTQILLLLPVLVHYAVLSLIPASFGAHQYVIWEYTSTCVRRSIGVTEMASMAERQPTVARSRGTLAISWAVDSRALRV